MKATNADFKLIEMKSTGVVYEVSCSNRQDCLRIIDLETSHTTRV